MHILENVDLRLYSTMRLGGLAKWLVYLTDEQDIPEFVKYAREQNSPLMVMGVGSNIIWQDGGYDGLILVNKLTGREILEETDKTVTLRLAAGENWDEVVAWTVKNGWSGIEFLSLIPGTVGGAPVQNIGAYGAELADVLVEVEAYDTKSDSFGGILNSQCNFGYRTSRFKAKDKDRFIITAIVLRLSKSSPRQPFYDSLQEHLDNHGILEHNAQTIRDAIVDIRSNKLPDPSHIANNGSFFINPVVEQAKFEELKNRYPDIRCWPVTEGKVKLAAGWLVEKAGFKDFHDKDTGMATWHAQSLVFVNEKAESTEDLIKFRQKILDKVNEQFGITLEQEPELLPTT